jgi:hypothetical protein
MENIYPHNKEVGRLLDKHLDSFEILDHPFQSQRKDIWEFSTLKMLDPVDPTYSLGISTISTIDL